MTTFKDSGNRTANGSQKLKISEILELISDGNIPLRFTAYDLSLIHI